MKCKDMMTTNPEWLAEGDTVRAAATRMAEAGVGFLPICDTERRVIGVITDRDLVTRGMAKDVVPATTPAALLMTSPPLTCPDTADVRDAETLMAIARKSRLVIVDDRDRFVGVLSIADLLEHAPSAAALRTVRAVMWSEALGPAVAAGLGDPLLQNNA
jgi:CBS domain-containing protein